MERHVFLEYIFRIHVLQDYVSWEVKLCRRTCLIGGNVFQECMSSRWHTHRMMCLTGGQVLLEGMSYRRACLTGRHVLQ